MSAKSLTKSAMLAMEKAYYESMRPAAKRAVKAITTRAVKAASHKTRVVKKARKKNPVSKPNARETAMKDLRASLNAMVKFKDPLAKQAQLSYADGLIRGLFLCGVITAKEAHDMREIFGARA